MGKSIWTECGLGLEGPKWIGVDQVKDFLVGQPRYGGSLDYRLGDKYSEIRTNFRIYSGDKVVLFGDGSDVAMRLMKERWVSKANSDSWFT